MTVKPVLKDDEKGEYTAKSATAGGKTKRQKIVIQEYPFEDGWTGVARRRKSRRFDRSTCRRQFMVLLLTRSPIRESGVMNMVTTVRHWAYFTVWTTIAIS